MPCFLAMSKTPKKALILDIQFFACSLDWHETCFKRFLWHKDCLHNYGMTIAYKDC
jgi:hypothetical protein